jgi:hypothetical protein
MNTEARQPNSEDLQGLCRRMYLETEQFYKTKAPQMGPAALGYAILYGPPMLNPEMLFLGFQPGGGLLDAEEGLKNGERHRWPERIHYAAGCR